MYSIYNDDTLHIFVAFYVVDLIVSMWLFLLVAPLWLVHIDCEIGRAWGLTSDWLDYIYTWTVLAFYVVENIEINPLNRNVLLMKSFSLWFFFSCLVKWSAPFLCRNVYLLIFIVFLFGFRRLPIATRYNGYWKWIMNYTTAKSRPTVQEDQTVFLLFCFFFVSHV